MKLPVVVWLVVVVIILTFVVLGISNILPRIEAHNTQIEEIR